MTKYIYISIILFVAPLLASGQIVHGGQLLSQSPDNRSIGLGDNGVATSADANSIFWNSAKYLFAKSKSAVSLNYTSLKMNDETLSLGAISGYYKLSDLHAFGVGVRYLKFSSISIYNEQGIDKGEISPSEYIMDLSYNYKLSTYWGVGLVLHLYNSDLLKSEGESAFSVSTDLSVFYERPDNDIIWRAGLVVGHIGKPLEYSSESNKAYLPAHLSLGGSVEWDIDPNEHTVTFAIQAKRLLVPGVEYDKDGNIIATDYSVFKSINESLSNDLASHQYMVSAEYSWRESVVLRTGYHYQSEDWGNRNYFSCGIKLQGKNMSLEGAYRMGAKKESLYHNSWAVGLGYCF